MRGNKIRAKANYIAFLEATKRKKVEIFFNPLSVNNIYGKPCFEVECEGFNTGYGLTLHEAIEDFDDKNY